MKPVRAAPGGRALVAGLALAGCAPIAGPSEPGRAALVLPDLNVRGVLVLHVDTLRADHLPAYGYGRDTTPRLGARAWRVVDGVRAPTSWTLPSTASFLTSLEPERHGLLWWQATGEPNAELVATSWPDRLRAEGWATALFTGNPFASAQSHLDPGFDVVALSPKESTGQHNLAVLGEGLLAWLDTLPAEQPFLAHLQPVDMHAPYAPDAEDLAVFRADPLPYPRDRPQGFTPQGFAAAWATADAAGRQAVTQAAIDVYDADLRGLDRDIDALLVALDDRGVLEDTLVVLTADHGETLNDPGTGAFGHQIAWREELVKLPLMLLHPAILPGEATCLGANIDVWPTIAARIGVEPATDVDGVDLAGGCRTQVRGSLWRDGGHLETLGEASAAGALQRDCRTGATAGTAIGGGADPTEETPPEDVPDGRALENALDVHSDEIAAIHETDCPG